MAPGGGVAVRPLDPAAALARLADEASLEALGTTSDAPVFAIDLRGAAIVSAPEGDAARVLSAAPCVTVAVAQPDASARALTAFDLVVTDEAALAVVSAAVAANPTASLVLAQLLRLGEGREIGDALVAESLAYSALQTGSEFRRWLEARPHPKPRSQPSGAAVAIDRAGDVLHLTLDRPAKRNAYSVQMRDALCEGLALAVADETIREVVLRGAGPDFCSGGDLEEFGTLVDPASAHAIRTTRSAGRLLARCADRVRSELHGACMGAGIELPAFGARIVARPDARFRLPEIGMGLVPGAGGTASLPRRIGRQRLAWWALTGAELDAETALDWGLVDEIAH